MSSSKLGSIGDNVFECLTKVLTTNKFELKEYADEENKPLVKLNLSK
jgi:hypothetical protein